MPAEPKTPKRGTTANNEVDTPMRMGANAPRSNQGTPSRERDVPASSPSGGVYLPATSPARAINVNMSEIDLSSPLNYGTPSSMGSIKTPRSGIRGTPVRARPDIRTDKRMRQVAVGGDLSQIPEEPGSETSGAGEPALVIWGTNVVVSQCKMKFKNFLMRYIDPDAQQDEISENIDVNEPLYMQKLEEIHTLEEPYLNVNCAHLKTYDDTLYRQLSVTPKKSFQHLIWL
uniref:MCM N-terminal domain-containing protein n=1 Tax=Megaselia scalaris TaxID=36166 RepID=T1GXX9_MEGSC